MRKYTMTANCPACGEAVTSEEYSMTLVAYYYPEGHDHDNNCKTFVFWCSNGHRFEATMENTCPACDWKGEPCGGISGHSLIPRLVPPIKCSTLLKVMSVASETVTVKILARDVTAEYEVKRPDIPELEPGQTYQVTVYYERRLDPEPTDWKLNDRDWVPGEWRLTVER